MLTWSAVLLALFVSIQGRAVNISNTWVLPEEGFPVFYRYFRDRISWYEADAVCQFHHANLVTVDTTAQYDAVRAYLKELDITSAVWVGLIRSNPDGEFTWTDYRGLSGDGYWSAAPDARAAPLCAAADPAADYRWQARACGGPTVASFICELAVPQWALGNQGCMVRALPALTVLYLPESAAVQLTADCGLAGTKRVQCTGNVKREDLLRNLSCAEDEDPSSDPNAITVGTTWSVTTDTVYTDQETTEATEENNTTEHDEEVTQANIIKTTTDSDKPAQSKPAIKEHTKINKENHIMSLKNINFDVINNNNLQSNYIPKLGFNENYLTVEQTDKLEDEKHMQIKNLHDELAKHGNFETIFSQPTDHFVPPLVMAKAKISNDMTVLSLAEKHAQQLAEQRFAKHNVQNDHNFNLHETDDKHQNKSTTHNPNRQEIDKPLVMTLLPTKVKDNGKKDNIKSGLPKKYLEKYGDPKGKTVKVIDNKLFKIDKSTEIPITSTENTSNLIKTTPIPNADKYILQEDSSMDLTVMLKELGMDDSRTPLFSNNSDKASTDVENQSKISLDKVELNKATEKVTTSSEHVVKNQTEKSSSIMPNIVTNHEVIKITIITDENSSNPTPIVFEITTKTPDFEYVHNDKNLPIITQKPTENMRSDDGISTNSIKSTSASTYSTPNASHSKVLTVSVNDFTSTPLNLDLNNQSILHTDKKEYTTEGTSTTVMEVSTTNTTIKTNNVTEDIGKQSTEFATTTINIMFTMTTDNADVASHADDNKERHVQNSTDTLEALTEFQHNTEASIATADTQYSTTREMIDIFNYTGSHEEDYAKNWTDSSETIDDFQSPLLSAANEPLHRPNRSRRPLQPNRLSKFNPFRILG